MSEIKLKETKGKFKLAGVVYGLDHENAYKEGVSEKNGKAWRRVQFRVKTSLVNEITVELMGMERDFVYPYSSSEKKSTKIPFEQRHCPPAGYHVIGTSMALGNEKDAKGKNKRVSMTEYDAVECLYENLRDGDHVFVTGSIEHSTYESEHTGTVLQTRYQVGSISQAAKPIDFEADDFAELASFEQEFVVTDTVADRENSKVLVNGYVIHYGEKFSPVQLVVNAATHSKLANAVHKKFRFGDLVKVAGYCRNSLEVVQIEDEDEWGSERPNGFNVGNRRIRELCITAVDGNSYEPKAYKEEDFVQGRFEESFDFGDDDDDEDLPF